MTQFWPEMKALEGKQVRVLLDREEDVWVEGKLLVIWPDGEFNLEVDGVIRYGWPALKVEEVPDAA